MSRYINLDEAIEHTNQLYHGYEVEAWLESLPTIEVSEDCISREWVLKAIDAEDVGTPDEMWRPAREYVEMIKHAPSVVPTVRKTRQVERAEGEWQLVNHLWECNRCQYRQNKSKPTNYCPNCGCAMTNCNK